MSVLEQNKVISKKKKKSKNSMMIQFDEEIVKKDAAQAILAKVNHEKRNNDLNTLKSDDINGHTSTITNSDSDVIKKKSKKRKKIENSSVELEPIFNGKSDEKLTPKKKQNKQTDETIAPLDESNELDQNETKQNTDSKRALKRRKHAQLLEEKKLQHELLMQEKSLNYLSRWKHSRNDWKFEKLRQIWLQQNMFDVAKIPNEFWTIVIEYFCKATGKIRKTILENAMKLIESNNNEMIETNDDGSSDEQVRIQRARDIVQSLQE